VNIGINPIEGKNPPMLWRGCVMVCIPYFLGLLIGTCWCSVVLGWVSAYRSVTKRPVMELRSTGFVGIVF